MGLYARLSRSRELYTAMAHGGAPSVRFPRPRRRKRPPVVTEATPLVAAERAAGDRGAYRHSLSCRIGCTECSVVAFTKQMRRRTPRCRRCGGMGTSEVMALDLTQKCKRCRGTGFEP